MRLPHDQDARRLAEIAEAARDCLLNHPALDLLKTQAAGIGQLLLDSLPANKHKRRPQRGIPHILVSTFSHFQHRALKGGGRIMSFGVALKRFNR